MMAFRVAAAQCKKICPERLNWPGRLAGISEGHRGIFSRPFFTIILSQKWCQISERIVCILPGTKNLQCLDFFFNNLKTGRLYRLKKIRKISEFGFGETMS